MSSAGPTGLADGAHEGPGDRRLQRREEGFHPLRCGQHWVVGLRRGHENRRYLDFRADEVMGGKIIHGRYTMTLVTPTKMSFSWEMSEDGTNWMLYDGRHDQRRQ